MTPLLWQKVKEESEKVGVNLNIQKSKIMASSPITSCEIDGETVETVAHVIFLYTWFRYNPPPPQPQYCLGWGAELA